MSFGGHDYVSAVDALDPEGADIRTVQPNTSYDALLKIAVLVRVARDAPADTIGIGRHFVRIAVDLAVLQMPAEGRPASGSAERADWQSVTIDPVEIVVDPSNEVAPCN